MSEHMHHSVIPRLGITSDPILLERSRSIRALSTEMAEQARRELLILGPTLDPAIYDQPAFLAAVKRLALGRSEPSVRVLVCDSRAANQDGQRLIDLARHLTSRITIRGVAEEERDRRDAFLVADARGFIHRPFADAMEGTADFNAPLEARRLRTEFERIWERSHEDSELRRLFI